MAKRLSALHGVVTVHPETGERILYVKPDDTAHIVELSRRESHHLLACLDEHLCGRLVNVWPPATVTAWC